LPQRDRQLRDMVIEFDLLAHDPAYQVITTGPITSPPSDGGLLQRSGLLALKRSCCAANGAGVLQGSQPNREDTPIDMSVWPRTR
jgi:hypothetical protein